MSMRKHIAFASMCMGLFIAQLDIQIVSSSLNEIGVVCPQVKTKWPGFRPAI